MNLELSTSDSKNNQPPNSEIQNSIIMFTSNECIQEFYKNFQYLNYFPYIRLELWKLKTQTLPKSIALPKIILIQKLSVNCFFFELFQKICLKQCLFRAKDSIDMLSEILVSAGPRPIFPEFWPESHQFLNLPSEISGKGGHISPIEK